MYFHHVTAISALCCKWLDFGTSVFDLVHYDEYCKRCALYNYLEKICANRQMYVWCIDILFGDKEKCKRCCNNPHFFPQLCFQLCVHEDTAGLGVPLVQPQTEDYSSAYQLQKKAKVCFCLLDVKLFLEFLPCQFSKRIIFKQYIYTLFYWPIVIKKVLQLYQVSSLVKIHISNGLNCAFPLHTCW